jgi:hypothetical protein
LQTLKSGTPNPVVIDNSILKDLKGAGIISDATIGA